MTGPVLAGARARLTPLGPGARGAGRDAPRRQGALPSKRPGRERLLGVAVEHATRRVPVSRPAQRAGEIVEDLLGQEFDCAHDVAVLESETLIGLVPIERLLAADSRARIGDLMDADPPAVAPDTDQERAARRMVALHECSLAVVDDEDRSSG